MTQQEVKSSFEECLPEINSNTNMLVETLRQNQEGRMQLSIEGLKQDFQASLEDIVGQIESFES